MLVSPHAVLHAPEPASHPPGIPYITPSQESGTHCSLCRTLTPPGIYSLPPQLWEPWLSQHSQKVNTWPEATYRPGMAAQVTRDGYQHRGTTHSPLWNLLFLKCPMKYMATGNHVDLEMELFFSLGCNTVLTKPTQIRFRQAKCFEIYTHSTEKTNTNKHENLQ